MHWHDILGRASVRSWKWSPLLAIAALAIACGSGTAQSIDPAIWCVNPGGGVTTSARLGGTLYIGGAFSSVGPATGGGAPISIASATRLPGAARVAGQVLTAVEDGHGGWYIGGTFSGVEGVPRNNLAHIAPDGTLAPWAPSADGEVSSLVLSGNRVYIGGDFRSLNGAHQPFLAAVSASSGELEPWSPAAEGRVLALLAHQGRVYVGGQFVSMAGQPRSNVAAFDSSTAELLSWDPNADGEVYAIASSDTTIYLGGRFLFIDDTRRPCLAAVGASSGELLEWDAKVTRIPDYPYDLGPRVHNLLVRDSTLYVAGSFKAIGGQPRGGIAAVSMRSAVATPWDPHPVQNVPTGPQFFSMAVVGDTMFIAGLCDSLAGSPYNVLGAITVSAGARVSWQPRPNGNVVALAVDSSRRNLFIGGGFTAIGEWINRENLAAIDVHTGCVLPWNPGADDYVDVLAVDGNTVYVGGWFAHVGGQSRSLIAAVDAESGVCRDWNPSADGPVVTLLPRGPVLMVGGRFTSIGGQARRYIAALDTATGLATAWNPDPDDWIECLAEGDSVIYVGGWFKSIGGEYRMSLAAVDPLTGHASPWDPGTNGLVSAITLLDSTIYIGGVFEQVNLAAFEPRATQSRQNLAAIDVKGVPLSWKADADQWVLTLAASGKTLYVGGKFGSIAGQSRHYIAALNAATADVLSWYPETDGYVWSLQATPGAIDMGGQYSRAGLWPSTSPTLVEAIDAPTPTSPTLLLVAQSAPNPTSGSTSIRYWLPRCTTVFATVYDIQGRRQDEPLRGLVQEAGPHAITLDMSRLPAGCYLFHMKAGSEEVTKRIVVVR